VSRAVTAAGWELCRGGAGERKSVGQICAGMSLRFWIFFFCLLSEILFRALPVAVYSKSILNFNLLKLLQIGSPKSFRLI